MPICGDWWANNYVAKIRPLEGGETEARRRRICAVAHVRLELSRLYRVQPIREDVAIRFAGAISRQ